VPDHDEAAVVERRRRKRKQEAVLADDLGVGDRHAVGVVAAQATVNVLLPDDHEAGRQSQDLGQAHVHVAQLVDRDLGSDRLSGRVESPRVEVRVSGVVARVGNDVAAARVGREPRLRAGRDRDGRRQRGPAWECN
jgi:hypothetical protein